MSVQELLDAISFSFQLSSLSQIVGFRDPTSGVIIPPSIMCNDPESLIKNETYEVMIRSVQSQPFQTSLINSFNERRQTSSNNRNNSLNHGSHHFEDTQTSFKARVGASNIAEFQQVQNQNKNSNSLLIQSNTPSRGAASHQQNSQIQVKTNFDSQNIARPDLNQGQGLIFEQNMNFQQQQLMRGSGRQIGRGFPNSSSNNRQSQTAPAGIERERNRQNRNQEIQKEQSPLLSQYTHEIKEILINLVESWSYDSLLNQSLKEKIIRRIQGEDTGVLAAYRLFLADHDQQALKARIIHHMSRGRLGTAGGNSNLTQSAEERQSSMTTAVFNRSADYLSRFSRGSVGIQNNIQYPNEEVKLSSKSNYQRFSRVNHQNTRTGDCELVENQSQGFPQVTNSQDRYLPIIFGLEEQGIIDNETASLLKTMILDENIDILLLMNSYLALLISDNDFLHNLSKLADQMAQFYPPEVQENILQNIDHYVEIYERPESPIPRSKNILLQQINMIARQNFANKSDISLLNQLIEEENEYVISSFEVFQSDKDEENLVDSLQRILQKVKQEQNQFFNQQIPSQINYGVPNNQNYKVKNLQQYQQQNNSFNQYSSNQGQQFLSRPETSQWMERPPINGQTNFQGINRAGRAQSINYQRNNRKRDRSHGLPSVQFGQFKPRPTMAHNVPLIPNYFSSGDEEGTPNANSFLENNNRNLSHQKSNYQNNISLGSGGFVRIPQNNGAQSLNTRHKNQQDQGQSIKVQNQLGGQYNFRQPRAEFRGTASFQIDNQDFNSRKVFSSANKIQENDSGNHAVIYQERGAAYDVGRGALYGINSHSLNQVRMRKPLAASFNVRDRFMEEKQYYNSEEEEYKSKNWDGNYNIGSLINQYRGDYHAYQPNKQLLVNLDDYGEEQNQDVKNYQEAYQKNNQYLSDSRNLTQTYQPVGSIYYEPSQQSQTFQQKFRPVSKVLSNGKNLVNQYLGSTPVSQINNKNNGNDKNKRFQKEKKGRRNNNKKYSSDEDAQIPYYAMSNNYFMDMAMMENIGRAQFQNEHIQEDFNNRASLSNNQNLGNRGFTNIHPESRGINRQKTHEAQEMSGESDFSKESSGSMSSDKSQNSELSDSASNQSSSVNYQKKNKVDKKRKTQQKKKDIKKTKKDKQEGQIDRQKSKSKQKMRKQDFKQVIEDQNLQKRLNIDNFIVLLYLIDNQDKEIEQAFEKHISLQKKKTQQIVDHKSLLLVQIQAKTEESFQVLLEQYLTNREQYIVRKQRNLKNNSYLQLFNQYATQWNSQVSLPSNNFIQSLFKDLRELVQEEMLNEERQSQFDEEQMEKTFLKLVYEIAKTSTPLREQFLRQQFEARDPNLIEILQNSVKNNGENSEDIKQQIEIYLLENLGQEVFTNLREALNSLSLRGYIKEEDQELLKQLNIKDDKHLCAAWDSYTVLQDESDFVDTLQLLCNVKRNNNSNADMLLKPEYISRIQPIQLLNKSHGNKDQDSGINFSNAINGYINEANSNDMQNLDRQYSDQAFELDDDQNKGHISDAVPIQTHLSNLLQKNEYENNSEKINKTLPESENAEDDEGQNELDDKECIRVYQHKILRKFSMLGMIQYTAIPYFHSLVHNMDYKMIQVFEVFAANRNEDEFLENLSILEAIRHAKEEEQMLQGKEDLSGGELHDAEEDINIGQSDTSQAQRGNGNQAIEIQFNMKNSFQNNSENQQNSRGQYQNSQYNLYSSNQLQEQTNKKAEKEIAQVEYALHVPQLIKMDFGCSTGDAGQFPTQSSISLNQGQNSQVNQLKQQENENSSSSRSPNNNTLIGSSGSQIPKKQDDSDIGLLNEFKDNLQKEAYEFTLKKVIEQDKKAVAIIKCYRLTKDSADFINSIQRFYGKAQK